MKNRKRNAFQWSLKPVLIFMRILGIRLDVSNSISPCSRLVINSVFGLFLASMVTISYKTLFIKHLDFSETTAKVIEKMTPDDQKQLLLLMIFVTFANGLDFILFYGSYIVLTVFSLNGIWDKLWSTLMEIQREFHLDKTFHRKIRRSCYIGIAVFVLVKIKY